MKINRPLDRELLKYPLHVQRVSDVTAFTITFARWWAEWQVAVCLRGTPR